MNTRQEMPLSKVRCTECGQSNSVEALNCGTCGSLLPMFASASDADAPALVPRGKAISASQATDPQPWSWLVAPKDTGQPQFPLTAPPASAPQMSKALELQGDLVGRVILVEPSCQEKPDFDWYRFLTKLLWFLLLIASPFLLLHAILVKIGALPAILAVIGMIYLLRFITPSNMFCLLQLHAILSPFRRHETEMVPVRYFRVRDDDEAEWMVRMKGNISLGNISADDLVSLWGRWRGGTLFVKHGYNHRTRSRVQLQGSYSWIGFALTVALVLWLVAYFWGPTQVLMHKMQELGGQR